MDYIKKVFKNFWLLSIFCIVIGLALIVDPGFFTDTIGRVIGGLFAAYGIVDLIGYFVSDDRFATGLVKGILMTAAGVFILIRPDFIPKVLAIICGLYMTISGIINIEDSINLKKIGVKSWKSGLIPAIITTAAGIMLLINPMLLPNLTMVVLGIALLISGISNIWGCGMAGKKLKKYDKLNKKGKLEKYKKTDGDDEYIDI